MGPFAPEVFRLPYPYPYRGVSAAEALRAFEEALHQQLGAESVACVVMELVAGEGGFLVADPTFVEAVRAICAEREVPAQLALESGMACGYGACFGCVVATKQGYVRLCVDGPVLDAADLELVA
jgi:adenosylmethionine-8-amino-7-oxononanoate aminotransferase